MAVSTHFATPGFTPEDSAARLARVQAAAVESGVDGILFVGGVDGRDNLGSVHGLNYLLGGLGGYDLLERQRVVSPWLEDVVLFVTPDTVDVHVGPEAYEIVRPVAAVWSRATKVTVRALPPRRVAAAERDAETRAEAKRREEAMRREARLEGGDVETREEEDANEAPTEDDAEPLFGSSESDADDDSEDDSDDSSDDDEDEDAAQDFKLESFVDVFVGMEKIGISVVVPYDTADSVEDSSANGLEAAPTEIERWPLAMAYGLEGVGRSGFFTMNFEVKDVCDTLRRTCYARLDRTALTRELDHNVPQFVAQWLDVADALEEASAGKRAALFSPVHIFDSRETNERAFAEALFDFFEYGSLRAPVGVRPACAVLDAPRVTLAKTHATVEATHPKSPGVKIARTFFLGDGARRAAAANGFVENDRFAPPGDECAPVHLEGDVTRDETHASLLAGAHAGVVAAARAAARALFAFAGGEAESSAAAADFLKRDARAAFSAAAKASGVRGAALARLADALVVETSATSFARETVEIMNDIRTFGHSFAYVRAAIELPADASFELPAVRVAHGDTYAGGTRHDAIHLRDIRRGDDDKVFPVAVTASVPASMRWPSVAEARVCEDAREVVDRAARETRFRGAKRREKARVDRVDAEAAPAHCRLNTHTPPRNPLMLAADPVAAEAGEDEAFFDDELLSSSEDEGPEEEEDEDEDEREYDDDDDDDDDSGPASRSRFVLDARTRRVVTQSPSLLPTPEKVCAFPAFTRGAGDLGDGDAAEALRELACPRGGAWRGEWRVFEDGVAFAAKNAPPLILTLGGNVTGVDVYDSTEDNTEDGRHENVTDAASRRRAFAAATVVAFKLRKKDSTRETGVVATLPPSFFSFQKPESLSGSSSNDDETGAHPAVTVDSICFSLAPMPARSRRRFLREVLPRWKKTFETFETRTGTLESRIRVDGVEDANQKEKGGVRRVASRVFFERRALSLRTRVALARARADARSAAASLSLGSLGLRAPVAFGAADAMADAALDRASRRDAVEAARRADDGERIGIRIGPDADVGGANDDVSANDSHYFESRENVENVENVPVSLLTGAPDGCQSAVFEALELGAPNAAAWIEAPLAAATHGEGAFLSEDAFLEALRAATPSVRAALGTAGTPPPHVVLVARTRATPRVVRGVFLSAARRFARELETRRCENEKETDGVAIRYVPGSTASCVSASGFFPEAERRPADCAAAADGADVVVLLPTAATERGDRADAAAVPGGLSASAFRRGQKSAGTPNGNGGSVFVDPDAETPGERLEDAKRWLVGFLGKAVADVRLVVGRARLRRDPSVAIAAVAGDRGGEDEPSRAARPRRVRLNVRPTPKTAADSRNTIVPTFPSSRETGRLVIATGRLDIAAVADAVRALFRSGRAPPPPSPETLAGLAPTARLERQLARFAERRADGADEAPFRVTHARVTVTLDPRGSPAGADDVADDVATKTVTCVFSSASPFSREKTLSLKKKQPSEREPEPSVLYASRVEVFLLGFGLGKANAGALLAACGDPGPAPLPRATRDGVSAERRDAIERALREDARNVPEGWYHDGTKWIDFDGSISHRHPLFAERVDALVEETNKKIEFENALRAEARDAARVTTRVETDAEVLGRTSPRDETVSAA